MFHALGERIFFLKKMFIECVLFGADVELKKKIHSFGMDGLMFSMKVLRSVLPIFQTL